MKKILIKEKEYNIFLNYYNYFVKKFISKSQWDKT